MHPLQQSLAEFIHQRVIGAHSLLHDFGRDSNHVRVANVPPFHNTHNIFARAEFTFERLHAQNSCVGFGERCEDLFGCAFQRTRREIFQNESVCDCSALIERVREARRDCGAGLIGDERYALAGLDRETRFDGVARARN